MSRLNTRHSIRWMLAASLAAACAMPVGADEAPESSTGWVPDEVKAQGSSRFT